MRGPPPEAEPAEAAQVAAAAARLQHHLGDAPALAVVLGSGLAGLANLLTHARRASYADLGLPGPTVIGHAGSATVGHLGGVRVVLLAGRVHLYEGRSTTEVVRAVRTLHAWGVDRLVLTNASGALRPDLLPGTLVRLVDHLNLTGTSALVGPPWGDRFPDTSRAWCPDLGAALDRAARELSLTMPHAVYAAVLGPAYETPAEVRMLRALGADVVGMSTVQEVLAALALGMRVAGVSVVTNLGAGVGPDAVDHASVARVAGEAGERLGALLARAAVDLASA